MRTSSSSSSAFSVALAAFAVAVRIYAATAETQFIYALCNVEKYENGTEFASSVDNVTGNLSATVANRGGFAAERAGEVNGIAQCRGDVSASDCQLCASAAASEIRSSCPNAVGARIELEYCFLRYEKYEFADKLDTTFVEALVNVNNNSDIAGFNATLAELMQGLTERAPTNIKRFADASAPINANVTLYGMVWCIRSISSADCGTCLTEVVKEMNSCCATQVGAQVYLATCSVRYEIYPFFQNLP